MSNWFSRFSATAAMVAASFAFGAADAAPGDALFTRPRQLVEADGARLNIICMGSGSPTIVFDAGHQDWSPAWAVVQPQVAQWTRACSFDRPGYGFSPAGPMPRTSEQIARELHDALHELGIGGPYVLVGHAFGGYNMRAFAYAYRPEVKGLVLIDTDAGDTAPPEVIARNHNYFIRQAVELRRCRDAVAAGDPKEGGSLSPGPPDLRCDRRFFRGFPEVRWSAELNAALLHMVRTRPELYEAAVDELQEMPENEFYLREHRRSLGSRPVRVITNARHFSDGPSTPPELLATHRRLEREIKQAQARFLTLSANSKQVFAARSKGSYVEFDEPELLLGAIQEAAGRSPRSTAQPAPHK